MNNLLFDGGLAKAYSLQVVVNALLATTIHSNDSISGVALFPNELNEPVTREMFPPVGDGSAARVFPGANVASDTFVIFECSFGGNGFYVSAAKVLSLLAGGIDEVWNGVVS